MSDSAATCQECGYVKLPIRFLPSPCPAYHSGLHRWSPDEMRAPDDRRDDYPTPTPIADVYDRLCVEWEELGMLSYTGDVPDLTREDIESIRRLLRDTGAAIEGLS